mgnify:CR=1 FL=1
MKIKLDENMPRRAGRLLSDQGHDVATVAEEGLSGKNDATVARVAGHEGRIIVTMDRRFVDIRRYPPGRHPGFVLLRLADQSAPSVEHVLRLFLDQYQLETVSRNS